MKLWQERRVLPESVIRRHIRDLDSANNPPAADPHCRRVERNERAFDDPLREVEGMVDEYGRWSSLLIFLLNMHIYLNYYDFYFLQLCIVL